MKQVESFHIWTVLLQVMGKVIMISSKEPEKEKQSLAVWKCATEQWADSTDATVLKLCM